MSLEPSSLHVIRIYTRRPPMSGGMEQHVASLSRLQRVLGVEVTDVFNQGEPNGPAVRVLPRIALHKLRPTILRDLILYTFAFFQLRSHLGRGTIRIIHAHGHWSAAAFARVLSILVRAKGVAFTVHGRIRVGHYRWRWALGPKMRVFATGALEAAFLEKILGRRVIQMPSAPDDAFFARTGRYGPQLDVIAVGSLVPVKNYELLLEVARRLPNLSFAVYGDGPLRADLEIKTRDLGVNNLEWRGLASALALRHAFASAKVFVNCSLEEGSPTAALEAMASGLPVILTPSNDYSLLLGDGGAGVALSGWDPEELELAIRELLDDGPNWAARSYAARQVAKLHRWKAKAAMVTGEMVRAAAEQKA